MLPLPGSSSVLLFVGVFSLHFLAGAFSGHLSTFTGPFCVSHSIGRFSIRSFARAFFVSSFSKQISVSYFIRPLAVWEFPLASSVSSFAGAFFVSSFADGLRPFPLPWNFPCACLLGFLPFAFCRRFIHFLFFYFPKEISVLFWAVFSVISLSVVFPVLLFAEPPPCSLRLVLLPCALLAGISPFVFSQVLFACSLSLWGVFTVISLSGVFPVLLTAEPPSVSSLAGASSMRSSCWDIPVCSCAGAFCIIFFSFEEGFFRALFHKIFVPAAISGYIFLGLFCAASAVPVLKGVFRRTLLLRTFSGLLFHGVFLHVLFCWGFPRLFFRRCFLQVPFLSFGGFFP